MKRLLRCFKTYRELERLRAEAALWAKFQPPGHYYSPLPSAAEIADAFARGGFGPPFAGVDLNEDEQSAVLEEIAAEYDGLPFPEQPAPGHRYHLDNPSYGHFDGIMLAGMILRLRPRRIIEVGSGFSSALMLDLNERRFDGRIDLTFIDPDARRLRALLRPEDHGRVRILERRVQEVDTEAFAALESGDVLFIDSSHVSKVGSDVNHLFFNILPLLRPGVHVHIHDIAGNLEYPRDWLEEGRAWNEQYLLRAFLMFNPAFRIVLFTSWIANARRPFLLERMPRCARGGGGQIWLRRVGHDG